MLKPTAILISVFVASALWVGPVHCQSTTSKIEITPLSEEELQRVRAALALSEGQQPKAALDTLGPVTTRIDTPWEIRSLVGELYEKTGDFANAARFYQSIVDELGPKVSDLPGNLYLRLGTVGFEQKDYSRATQSLELALKYRGYQDDRRIYGMLMVAYRQTDRIDMADKATLLQAAADPNIRPEVPAISSSAWTSDSSPLPKVPAPGILQEILAGSAPTEPPTAVNFPLSAASLKYSDALEAAGWTRAASRYRGAAYDLVYKKASSAMGNNDNDGGLRELARVSTLPGYADLPLEVRGVGLQLEMKAHLGAGRFTHAAGALARLAETGAYNPSKVTDQAIQLQRLAFSNVSFDSGSGTPRSTDSTEFLDTGRLLTAVQKANGEKPSLSREQQTERALSPYSKVSQSEDWAEMVSAVLMARRYPAAKRELLSILRLRLKQRQFELPVKFSLHLIASRFLDEKLGDGNTIGDVLRRDIFTDRTPTPRATTLDAYTAGEKLAALIKDQSGKSR